jgi:hypothetical protein
LHHKKERKKENVADREENTINSGQGKSKVFQGYMRQ